MGLKDMFGKKKAQRPVGAKSAKRQRRGSTGGGVDQGYLFEGVFYLEDGTESRDSDYAGSAYVSESYSSGSNGSYGGSNYGETSNSGGYGYGSTPGYTGSDSRDTGGGGNYGGGGGGGSDNNGGGGGGGGGGSFD